MKYNGILISIAYPDQYVRATESRYNWILKHVGIVTTNMVQAGHSAVALINKESGHISYADFGRYITPTYFGRCRTSITDPEVHIPVKATFDQDGNCINIDEILFFFRDRMDVTKGSGRCFAGLFDVDYEKAFTYMHDMSICGSLPYGPFDLKGNNCSRFTWNTLFKSRKSWFFKLRMYWSFIPTIMPLDIVMLAKKGCRFEVSPGGLISCKFGQLDIWKKLFEKFEGEEKIENGLQEALGGRGNWVNGLCGNAFFNLKDVTEEGLLIERIDSHEETIFSHFFSCPDAFDPNQNFEFVHDCNAYKCTFVQNGRTFIANRNQSKEYQINTLTFHQPLENSASLRS